MVIMDNLVELRSNDYPPDDKTMIKLLEKKLHEEQIENNHLRCLLAKGDGDCVYCGLPESDISKCVQGFPGCGRMDDLVNCVTTKEMNLVYAYSSALADLSTIVLGREYRDLTGTSKPFIAAELGRVNTFLRTKSANLRKKYGL